jgi:hypothetical protein
MRGDLAVVEPSQHVAGPIGRIGCQTFRLQVKGILRPVHHGPCRTDLGLTDRPAGLDIDDDGIVCVDQIVDRIGEDRRPVHCRRPLACRIAAGDELRAYISRCPESGIIECFQIFADGTGRSLLADLRVVPLSRKRPA